LEAAEAPHVETDANGAIGPRQIDERADVAAVDRGRRAVAQRTWCGPTRRLDGERQPIRLDGDVTHTEAGERYPSPGNANVNSLRGCPAKQGTRDLGSHPIEPPATTPLDWSTPLARNIRSATPPGATVKR